MVEREKLALYSCNTLAHGGGYLLEFACPVDKIDYWVQVLKPITRDNDLYYAHAKQGNLWQVIVRNQADNYACFEALTGIKLHD